MHFTCTNVPCKQYTSYTCILHICTFGLSSSSITCTLHTRITVASQEQAVEEAPVALAKVEHPSEEIAKPEGKAGEESEEVREGEREQEEMEVEEPKEAQEEGGVKPELPDEQEEQTQEVSIISSVSLKSMY